MSKIYTTEPNGADRSLVFLIFHGYRSYLAVCEKLERQREASGIKMLPCLGQSADLEPMLAIFSSIFEIYNQINGFHLVIYEIAC